MERKKIRGESLQINSFRNSIKTIISEYMNEESFEYIFSGIIEFEDFVTQILFEKYKEVYLISSKKSSLRSYIQPGETFDSDYQQLKRILSFSNYYKENKIENLTEKGIDFNQIFGLKVHVTENITEKIAGLSLSELDIFQLITMQQLELLKSITTKRIVSSKKISNKRFIEMFKAMDNYYLDVKKVLKADNFFYHLINFYDLERNYFTELVYRIATYIDEQNLREYNIENFAVLFNIAIADINFQSANRFLKHRHAYIAELINGNQTTYTQLVHVLYQKAILVTHFKDRIDRAYRELDLSHVEKHLMQKYNLFDTITYDKEWNNKKIKIVRSFYDKYLDNVKFPENRT